MAGEIPPRHRGRHLSGALVTGDVGMAAANVATTTRRPEYPFWRGGRHLADPFRLVPNEPSRNCCLRG